MGQVNVGLIGYKFMGKAHSNAYKSVGMFFPLQNRVVMKAICGRDEAAVAVARRMIREGKLGDIYHFRGAYLQDWITDPEFPLVWRLDKKVAGSGALGDIGAHIIDLALFLVGEIAEVVADLKTFIKK